MPLVLEERYLPARLHSEPMSDEAFAELCASYPDLVFEMTAESELIVMPPNFTLAGIRNREILAQLDRWASSDGRGITADASAGFVLANGARRSPDASWISRDAVAKVDPAAMERYWHLCPEFVIELRSPTDRLPVLREKMREWIEAGALEAWLVDPESRTVEVFRPGREPAVVSGSEVVRGEGPVAGFELALRRVWEPLGI